ncbi:proline-rich protein 29 isoform X3 [Vidua macroura]|uniref:proline-rich protein 29 isoform X3 n=1 Tax=Vidua macroura TaxID=187451 RepID=UPI0023A8B657|nr:proline-rich protein 29 isoform X3 [Vidua macroura]
MSPEAPQPRPFPLIPPPARHDSAASKAKEVTAGTLPADLMELMLIQTSQMHQLLMHGLAVAALMPLGAGPAPAPAQALAEPSQGKEEEEAVVFHHHYIPWPVPGPAPVRFLRSSPGDGRAVPPPPPPSATRTVGPGVPPAAEFYSAEEWGL